MQRTFPDMSESPWTHPDTGTIYEYVDGMWQPQAPSGGGGNEGNDPSTGLPYVIGTPPGVLIKFRDGGTIPFNDFTPYEGEMTGTYYNGTYIGMSRKTAAGEHWINPPDMPAGASIYSKEPNAEGIYELMMTGMFYSGGADIEQMLLYKFGMKEAENLLGRLTSGEDYIVCFNAPLVEYKAA